MAKNKKSTVDNEWFEFMFESSKANKEFHRIIDFYILNCPSYQTNVQSRKIVDYGWNTPIMKRSLTSKLKKTLPKLNCTLCKGHKIKAGVRSSKLAIFFMFER